MTRTEKSYATEDRLTAPVVHMTAKGEHSTNATHALPLVRVQFSWNPVVMENGRATVNGLQSTWALIDTGADYSLLSARYASGCGPAVEVFNHTGLGRVERATTHEITLYFPPADIITRAGVLLSGAIGPDSIFQMILGRHFLKMTRFIYDGPKGIREISFISQDELDALGVK
ncbi:hypothetical protein [Brevundimonas diminuta]|uniref:hypothetical protein n=1 Tax=Brevundimonas diminuta TaxID=293 RepID=UPI003F7FB515